MVILAGEEKWYKKPVWGEVYSRKPTEFLATFLHLRRITV